VRTLLGIGAGIAWASAWPYLIPHATDIGFCVSLFPVRMVEWSTMIWLFHERRHHDLARLAGYSVLVSGWSYVLDLPAVLSIIAIPGVMWIC
jgi:hypothetical protein